MTNVACLTLNTTVLCSKGFQEKVFIIDYTIFVRLMQVFIQFPGMNKSSNRLSFNDVEIFYQKSYFDSYILYFYFLSVWICVLRNLVTASPDFHLIHTHTLYFEAYYQRVDAFLLDKKSI